LNERVNRAVQALLSDKSLLFEFQENPADAMRQFGLTECELDAVRLGDEQSLLDHGMDPALIGGQAVAPHWFGGLIGTVARRMAAPAVLAILLALGVHAADSQTASAARANIRAGRRISGIRIHGPSGLRRASIRARARSNVRAARAGIRARASARAGLGRALAQVGCQKCLPPPSISTD
jgi:hypothetical protein